jgi:hypothetical protein
MKKAILAFILACAGCCAVPLLFPALAGLGVFGASLFHSGVTLDSILCGISLAGLAFIGVYLLFRFLAPAKPKVAAGETCKADGGCGCK